MDLIDFIKESNRIEGIHREPTPEEIEAHKVFLARPVITFFDIGDFVREVAGARLRNRSGDDVRVGDHRPPPGGAHILGKLVDLLDTTDVTPYDIHHQYETLHPCTDGNGRSGRVLWLWMMGGIDKAPLGFLHTWYYQSLQAGR